VLLFFGGVGCVGAKKVGGGRYGLVGLGGG